MRRICTEMENRIIKESAGDILSCPETYTAVYKSNFISMDFWSVAGLGLGIAAALKLSVSAETWIRFITVIFISVVIELFVLICQAFHRKKMRKKRLPGDKFQVNGGTIINLNYSKVGVHIIFAEDELTDNRGNPCCIMMPASYCMTPEYGERILLVYSDSGAYIPLRVTERTRDFIPEQAPEYFSKVNWSEAVRVPHPAAIDLDQKSAEMYEYEKAEFVKKYNSLKNIGVKNWLGIVLLSLLTLFLSGILFICLVSEDIITEFSTAVIFVILIGIVWMYLTYRFAKAIFTGRTRGLKKIKYKKKVMFYSINHALNDNNIRTKYLSVYEYINGRIKLVSYPVNGNAFLPKTISYGRIIYKYSEDAESCAKDLNFFAE